MTLATTARTGTLAGTARLVRLGLRRDRFSLLAWTGSLGLLTAFSVVSVAGLYPTESDRLTAAAFMAGNRLSRAFDGPASGPTLGAVTIVESYVVLAVLAALMSIFIVTRLTRQDEETGRAELVSSAMVGRGARLTAALIVALIANLVLGAVITAVLVSQDLPVGSAVVAGVALAAAGIAFAAVAAVTAQLASFQRAANGLAGVVLAVAFLLRAVGDAAGTTAGDTKLVSAWPSWLSPIGWGQQVRPFGEDRLEVFTLFVLFTVVLVAVAYRLNGRRDLGAGMLGVRPGPATAEGRLGSPARLLWRLQRGSLLAWTVAVATFAVAFASLGDGADEITGLSDEIDDLFDALIGEGELVDVYVAFVVAVVGIVVGGYTVQSLLRARTEESSGRIEAILSGSVDRRAWLGATVAVAVVTATGILAVVALVSGVTFGVATGDLADGLASFGAATAVQLPAVLALGGFVVAVVGLVPRWAPGLAWAALAASLVFGLLGPGFGFPQALVNVSPFSHVPALPAADFTLVPLAALLAVAAGLGAAGVAGFRNRDLRLS